MSEALSNFNVASVRFDS